MKLRRNFRIGIASLYAVSLFGPWDVGENFFDLVADGLRYAPPNPILVALILAVIGVPAGAVLVIFRPRVGFLVVIYRILALGVGGLFLVVLFSMWAGSSFPIADWGFLLFCLTVLLSFPVEYLPVGRRRRPPTDPDVFE